MVQITSLEEPAVTIRDLLAAGWNAANTVLASAPDVSTGWWDRSNVRPQVTVTPLPQEEDTGSRTGWSSIRGDGSGLNQRVLGEVQVDCWAQRDPDDVSGPNPKTVVWDLASEVKRIVTANATGGTGSLEWLGYLDGGRTVDTSASPAVFRYTLTVRFGYVLTP